MKLQSYLTEYRQAMKRRHNDCNNLKIKVIRKRGWVKFPTGVIQYIADLELSGSGYRTKQATLFIEKNGKWWIN